MMSNYADVILQSNCIFTAAGEAPFAGFVAVCDGKIKEVGHGRADPALVGPQTQVYELGEQTVCPGFSDVHCFFAGYAAGFVGVDLSGCRSEEEMLAAAKAYAATVSEDRPVLGHGWDPETITPSGSKPLDETFGQRPVVLFAAGNENCWMNQAAMDVFHFTPDACYNESFVLVQPHYMADRDFIVPLFKDYMHLMNSRGVTSVKEMGFDRYYGFTDVLAELEQAGDLTLRVNFMSQPVAAGVDLEYGKAMRDKFQGEFVRFSGYNQMTDGSISQMCGYLKKPYNGTDTVCAQQIDWDKLAEDTRLVDREGFRFSLHAQGDGAIGKVLDIYETCKRDGDGRMVNRHSITDLEFSDPADLERMGAMGVVAEVYPQIQSIADREGKLAMIAEKIGMDRGRYYWNRRKMADSGVILSCGTDLPLLVDDIPQSVYHAVGGYFPEGGEPFNKQNMLTTEELMTAWTRGGAYDLYSEDTLGTLETGKKADIAVLSGNIFTTAPEDARSLDVEMTLLGGKIVYQKERA